MDIKRIHDMIRDRISGRRWWVFVGRVGYVTGEGAIGEYVLSDGDGQ